MIHVDRHPEPINFETLVRQPGRNYLRIVPFPTTKQFNNHDYWGRVLGTMYDLYDGICAYSCHWIPVDTGTPTVEHFYPKHLYPQQAYEWNNYRLVCGTLNGRKKAFEDVLDPFTLVDGWFIIDFPSGLVKPSKELDDSAKDQVRRTIARLGLNHEGTCLRNRLKWIMDYSRGAYGFQYLSKHAPFVGRELERQGLCDAIKTMMF